MAGNDNNATVTGDRSQAVAAFGNNNTATVTGDGSLVVLHVLEDIARNERDVRNALIRPRESASPRD